MAIEQTEITLPSYWAPSLINGYASNMTAEEIDHMNAYLDKVLEGGWYVVSDVENSERFTWYYELYGGFKALGGSVTDYIIHRVIV